ncbi:Sucrose phosphorylase [Lachnospiraceae bacterium TWA4]|nr:Sucrose phosphorylase [Lachnospiraceae bacterium TWA4]
MTAKETPVDVYDRRFKKHFDELKWLYMELYPGQDWAFDELCKNLYGLYEARNNDLRELDLKREADPTWYKKNDLLGMMMYVDAFAGNLNGVREKLDYVKECNVNYLHLMPLLDSPEGKSDGGYAVADFRKVRPDLGTMEDLQALTSECHKDGISVCLDFVMNHTSEDHEWARRARAGEKEYQDRFFVYDNYEYPSQFEKTVPQVFPTTAPGNFTWFGDMNKFVMTTFYPYQWDLNYWNPVVMNEMIYNMVNLANQGIDIIRLDAVPYIWKQLGTNCRNLPQVHTIVRIMRMISEIVCPSVLLLGEVVMEPKEVVPYFGTPEKPECHMLYNVTTMATTWNTVATADVGLLKSQMDIISTLPKEYVFLNYLRCHDDIGWGLDYNWLSYYRGAYEPDHKQYLNDFLKGAYPGTFARGELYNDDPVTRDARMCGTTASLCGIEKADYEGNQYDLDRAIRFDLTLHAYMFTQSGIPVLYSGDEIGQLNDYDYHKDPKKWDDSRYLHRGAFNWDNAEKRNEEGTIQERIFHGLNKLEKIRASYNVFSTDASVWTLDTWDNGVLCVGRSNGYDKLIGLFNFTSSDRTAWIDQDGGYLYKDLFSGMEMEAKGVNIPAFGFYWLFKTDKKVEEVPMVETVVEETPVEEKKVSKKTSKRDTKAPAAEEKVAKEVKDETVKETSKKKTASKSATKKATAKKTTTKKADEAKVEDKETKPVSKEVTKAKEPVKEEPVKVEETSKVEIPVKVEESSKEETPVKVEEITKEEVTKVTEETSATEAKPKKTKARKATAKKAAAKTARKKK